MILTHSQTWLLIIILSCSIASAITFAIMHSVEVKKRKKLEENILYYWKREVNEAATRNWHTQYWLNWRDDLLKKLFMYLPTESIIRDHLESKELNLSERERYYLARHIGNFSTLNWIRNGVCDDEPFYKMNDKWFFTFTDNSMYKKTSTLYVNFDDCYIGWMDFIKQQKIKEAYDKRTTVGGDDEK